MSNLALLFLLFSTASLFFMFGYITAYFVKLKVGGVDVVQEAKDDFIEIKPKEHGTFIDTKKAELKNKIEFQEDLSIDEILDDD